MVVRCGFASLAVIATACAATSPPPLPPRHPVSTAAPAAQRAPDLVAPAEPPVEHERYIVSMLVADVVSIPLFVKWLEKPDQLYYALPTLALPPLVHVAHGESDKAAISLAMRGATLGIVYALTRDAQNQCASSQSYVCIPIGQFVLAGSVLVMVVVTDSVLLARRARPNDAWLRLPILPMVTPSGGGLTYVGSF